MRILIVAFTISVHTARYLHHFEDTDWDIEVFDSQHQLAPHPDTPARRLHVSADMKVPEDAAYTLVPCEAGSEYDLRRRVRQLSRLIDEFQPDLIHSHEMQHSGALVDIARIERGGLPCPWIQTSWGSDISMYGRHPHYVERIKSICAGADYFGGECHRDIALARAMGFTGRGVGVWPVVGGLDTAKVAALSQPGPTSSRRSVTVKGVASSIARGEVAAKTLELLGDSISGYEVCTYQTSEQLREAFERTVTGHGGTYRCLSMTDASQASHEDILSSHGRSRVSLALNLSDGMSNSFMEAMAAGSFPVHSRGACGREVTPEGQGAFFVSPTEPQEAATAVARALEDDELVDRAAQLNMAAAVEFFDSGRIRARILDMYERVYEQAALEALR